ncbi:hypothetical protein LEP1GSC171_1941 [Leptospira santarosai str. HAI1380]|uniref:Uncharacterized protein n=2 Tax=Leptospira santarosai TaxID=28183 RepID=M6UZP7_9LEPT|nr:hypothetical protein LEP1GSC063_2906 [Leptospira santarosai serovar Arenal str. MAVJ 401]EMO46474.1 hypothetical protein LEP1GSC187_1343 [Leptospira santarosai str. ZUN179]EMP04046.1 hypothetical protein LEP1GSC171_1941 [Leptospira santarosai str. HAI1380]KXZ31767.1 hypothetical protein AYB33_02235 [Leptospira santarosai]
MDKKGSILKKLKSDSKVGIIGGEVTNHLKNTLYLFKILFRSIFRYFEIASRNSWSRLRKISN